MTSIINHIIGTPTHMSAVAGASEVCSSAVYEQTALERESNKKEKHHLRR